MNDAFSAPERELTHPVALTLPDGRLNPRSVGWARQPLVDTSGIGRRFWGRNKRWEYWCIVTPTHVVAVTVSSLDYAAVHEVWAFDRATHRTWGTSATLLPARRVTLPASLDAGPVRAEAKGLRIAVSPADRGTRIQAESAEVALDVVADLPDLHERLAVVVPWSATRFQYTVKDVARPVQGVLTVAGEEIDIPAGDSWAILDHGRGRWRYDSRWNWGAAGGQSYGRVVGIQVGGRWTVGTGSTENAFFVDGMLHKIHGEVEWEYDITEWRRPWRVSGGGLDASFEPVYDKVSRTSLGIVSSATDQCFGHWSGTFQTADGEAIPFDHVFGFAEEVRNRW